MPLHAKGVLAGDGGLLRMMMPQCEVDVSKAGWIVGFTSRRCSNVETMAKPLEDPPLLQHCFLMNERSMSIPVAPRQHRPNYLEGGPGLRARLGSHNFWCSNNGHSVQ